MMPLNKIISIILFIGLSTGSLSCATARGNQLLLTSGAFGVGSAVGAATAPRGESRALHGLLWGAVAGVVSSVAGLFIFDESGDHQKTKADLARREAELSQLRAELAPKLIADGASSVGKQPPSEIRGLVAPGSWRYFAMDRWISDGENRLVHQDRLLEITPSSLWPASNVQSDQPNQSKGAEK